MLRYYEDLRSRLLRPYGIAAWMALPRGTALRRGATL
jgi:hypothetical protein